MNLTRVEVQQLVETRAGQQCEYCRMHQSLQGASFHVEHIKPISLGGTCVVSNSRNEAFSRILIDKALEDSGWDLLNPQQT
jgi:hypothetical protein